MNERPVLLGENSSVLGILTRPDNESTATDKPAVLILNAGFMYRIGPFRMHVALARRLATQGITTLRIDCSGKGDSPARAKVRSYDEAVSMDVKDAMDFVKSQCGIDRFILVGLCSGADDAFRASKIDARISGLVLLDGYAYPTARYYLRRYGRKLLSVPVWFRFAVRTVRKLSSNGQSQQDIDDQDFFGMAFPPKEEFEKGLQEVVDRDGRVLVIHSSGWAAYYNYKEQFRDAFPALARTKHVSVKYFPKADHTYSLSTDREILLDTLVDWIG